MAERFGIWKEWHSETYLIGGKCGESWIKIEIKRCAKWKWDYIVLLDHEFDVPLFMTNHYFLFITVQHHSLILVNVFTYHLLIWRFVILFLFNGIVQKNGLNCFNYEKYYRWSYFKGALHNNDDYIMKKNICHRWLICSSWRYLYSLCFRNCTII